MNSIADTIEEGHSAVSVQSVINTLKYVGCVTIYHED